MKKIFTLLSFLLLFSISLFSQKELIYNTTGFGFDRNQANGIAPDQWTAIQRVASQSYSGQDASVTAVAQCAPFVFVALVVYFNVI